MPPQNDTQKLMEAIMASKAEVLQAVAAEKTEVLAAINALQAKLAQAEADYDEIVAAVQGIYTPPPA